jgi:hypothetical protein
VNGRERKQDGRKSQEPMKEGGGNAKAEEKMENGDSRKVDYTSCEPNKWDYKPQRGAMKKVA